jgi:polysaccharide biosynthesis transport protein
MSRIADVLRRAAAERGSDTAGSDSGPADHGTPDDVEKVVVPWTIENADGSAVADHMAPDEADDAAAQIALRPRGSTGLRRSRRLPPKSDRAGGRHADVISARDLRRYGEVLRRRWAIGVLIFVVVVIGISAGALFEEPVYRATGLLEIRPETTGLGPVETLFSAGRVATDELETQFGILKSATLAEHTIRRLISQDQSKKGQTQSVAAVPLEWAWPGRTLSAEDLQDSLVIDPQRGSRLVKVSFDAPTPTIASRVVNGVFDTYLQLRMEEAKHSADWLQEQLQAARQRLEQSERQLHAYTQTHGLQVLETGKGETADAINQRLDALHQALTTARADRIEKQSAAEQARLQASARNLDSPVIQNLSVRLADLRREHAKLASTFHDDYPAVQALNSQIAELQRALDDETALVAGRAQREYRAAARRESLLRQELNRASTAADLGNESEGPAGYAALKRELLTNQAQFTALNQKLKEVSISTALKAANVGIVDRAEPPDGPYGSSFDATVGLAVMVGLVLGVGGMFLRELLDTSMRSSEDVDDYLGVPTLAAIPAVVGRSRALPLSGGPASLPDKWQSSLAEAFAALRTAVLLEGHARGRTLLITSARSAEGKTTVSINLALSLARLKHRVLLIDANMREPSVQRLLQVDARPGLAAYLASDVDWRGCVDHARPNLDVLVTEAPATSPADLLSLPRMRQLIAEAAAEYAIVLIDAPALLPHPADVQSLANLADSVLLTVRQGTTPREAVAMALSQLPRVSGVVLNQSDAPEFAVSAAEASAAT